MLDESRLHELFAAALGVSEDRRSTFVADACGGDLELRRALESVLAREARVPADFMVPPFTQSAQDAPDALDSSLIGQRVGQYIIEDVIAHGGMGSVYRAQQDAPQRRIALKILHRYGMDRLALRRFQFESEVLGYLVHPGIAQVYEAGIHSAESGRSVPFFAMELVPEAQPITTFAEAHRLGLEARIELFRDVCQAIHHGHQKGVIHRDLKPGNILVGTDGRPKVIDFGVARSTNSDLAATTLRTDVGQLIGTVRYMSPEQASAQDDLDIRSDVYSLGVVLYELLTGGSPYARTGSSVVEVTRAIEHQPPVRPSKIDSRLGGDLEVILLKCLGKDRERRYQSAGALEEDLRRYLANEPIAARPPSGLYQLSLLARRHRAACAAVVVALLALIVASFGVGSAIEAERLEVKMYGWTMSAAEAALHLNDPATARRLLDGVRDTGGWEWRHLHHRVSQDIDVVLDGIPAARDMVVDKAGKWLVACLQSEDIVRIVDLAGDDSVAPLTVTGMLSATLSPDGRWLAVAHKDDRAAWYVSLYDLAKRPIDEPVLAWPTHSLPITSLAFDTTSQWLASGDGKGHVQIWQRPTAGHSPITPFMKRGLHASGIERLAFAPDGQTLASSAHDGTIQLWRFRDPESASNPMALRGHTRSVEDVTFSSDGQLLAAASMDGTISLWDPDTAASLHALPAHEAGVTSVLFSSDARLLFSAGADHVIRLWGLRGSPPRSSKTPVAGPPILLSTLRGHEKPIHRLALASDRLLSVCEDGTIRAWLPLPQDDPPVLRGHKTSVNVITCSPDDRYLFSGAGREGALIKWDLGKVELLSRFPLMQGEAANDVAWITDHSDPSLAWCTDRSEEWCTDRSTESGGVLITDLDLKMVREMKHPATDASYVSIASAGQVVAASDQAGTVWLWNMADPTATPRSWQIGNAVRVRFADEAGRWLLAADAAGTTSTPQLRVYDVIRETEGRSWPLKGPAWDLEVDQPRGLVAVAGNSIEVFRFDAGSRGLRLEPLHSITNLTAPRSVAFHPSGTRLACGSDDGIITLWDTRRWEEAAILRDQTGPVVDLQFSGTGEVLASTSGGCLGRDNVIRLWEEQAPSVQVRRDRAKRLLEWKFLRLDRD